MIERSMGASLFIGFEFCKLNISLRRKREQIAMGTPSNIIWQGISKLCAKFHAFITLVTIEQKLCVKPPDYYGHHVTWSKEIIAPSLFSLREIYDDVMPVDDTKK